VSDAIADLLRELTPQVLAIVTRRFGDFDAAEDAVQDALVAAAMQWPTSGTPDRPRAWLVHVAARRMTDRFRSDHARRSREELAPVPRPPPQPEHAPDDTLALLFLCCHPALTSGSAIALTLRAVAGLTTAEIANAFLVPEATMAQRISRAKRTIKTSGVPFEMPASAEWASRLHAALHILYLIFNEGYTSSIGPDLQRRELASEAIRLTRIVLALRPADPEIEGLLALMLLVDARWRARTDAHGDLIPLSEQDRSLWDRAAIEEGVALVTSALRRGAVGPYQLQAAIAAVHDEAARVEDTDWPQILALYGVLEHMNDNPMIVLNRIVATAMVHGPKAGLDALETLEGDARLAGHYRIDAVRGHLLEMSGDLEGAIASWRAAASKTTSIPERRYLERKANQRA
jgi:RNA polymerase sigma factor (sigma-70 family)